MKKQIMNTMEQNFVENFDDCTETLKQEIPEYKDPKFINKKIVVDTRPNTLSFLETEELFVIEEEWENMPEFIQEDEELYRTVLVKFETKEDFEAFEKLIGHTVMERVSSTFFPKRDVLTSSDVFWVHDDE